MPQISSFLILTSQQYKGAKTNPLCYNFYCVNKHCITTSTLRPAQKYLRTTKWSLDPFHKISVCWNALAFIQGFCFLGCRWDSKVCKNTPSGLFELFNFTLLTLTVLNPPISIRFCTHPRGNMANFTRAGLIFNGGNGGNCLRCPWSLPWCPFKSPNRNLQIPHRGALCQGKVALPLQVWSVRPARGRYKV